MPLIQLYLGRWFYSGKLHFLLKVSVSQEASLSIQSPKPAQEDVFLYPILTLLRPTALIFAPAPTAQPAWCCTETQSAGSVHCRRCETSLRQQQRDPGSVGKKGEAQAGSYTATQHLARKYVVFILQTKLCEFKQSKAALKSSSCRWFSLFRITTLHCALV